MKGKRDIPIEQVLDLYIMTEMSFNTSLVNLLSQAGVIAHFFNYYNFYIGSYYPKDSSVSGSLLVKQVQHYSENRERMHLACEFVASAADGIYRNLRYYQERGKELSDVMLEISALRKLIPHQETVQELMGLEGNIHKLYYEAWNQIINQELEFERRVKRPPDNVINTMISFVNSLIYTTVLSQIYHTHLNPTISYLHEPGVRRFSLALDLAEIFKPLIGDRLIFSMLNKNQITEDSFTKGLNYSQLTETGSKKILAEFDKRLNTTIKHKELGKDVSYRYLIRLECYKIVKHLIGEKEYTGFRIWW